jgi:hypothetical protein
MQPQEGDNRRADLSNVAAGSLVVLGDENFRFKGNWRGAGVAIPVFSLRSHSGFGVGEFPDIKLMVCSTFMNVFIYYKKNHGELAFAIQRHTSVSAILVQGGGKFSFVFFSFCTCL